MPAISRRAGLTTLSGLVPITLDLPEFLAIGHAVRDIGAGGLTAGGTVTYGALTALKLGLRPSIVTSAGPDFVLSASGIQVHTVPSDETTTFRNDYAFGERVQHLESVAAPISPWDIPPEWRPAPMVLLGPLTGEVDHELARYFPNSLVVASLQGWLRRWDANGLVAVKAWEGLEVLPYVDAAVVSEKDFEDGRLLDTWAEIAAVLILTMGDKGARLHTQGRWHDIPPCPAREVDPTGAGDVFAAAYVVRYSETGDPLESALFAGAAASLSVEAPWVSGIPTRPQVDARLGSRPMG
jgi:sugar/nucleoside kinase (ribokinase family)